MKVTVKKVFTIRMHVKKTQIKCRICGSMIYMTGNFSGSSKNHFYETDTNSLKIVDSIQFYNVKVECPGTLNS